MPSLNDIELLANNDLEVITTLIENDELDGFAASSYKNDVKCTF